jgi:hypothetical protein
MAVQWNTFGSVKGGGRHEPIVAADVDNTDLLNELVTNMQLSSDAAPLSSSPRAHPSAGESRLLWQIRF